MRGWFPGAALADSLAPGNIRSPALRASVCGCRGGTRGWSELICGDKAHRLAGGTGKSVARFVGEGKVGATQRPLTCRDSDRRLRLSLRQCRRPAIEEIVHHLRFCRCTADRLPGTSKQRGQNEFGREARSLPSIPVSDERRTHFRRI